MSSFLSGTFKACRDSKPVTRTSYAMTLATKSSTSPDQHDLEAGGNHEGETNAGSSTSLEQPDRTLQAQLASAIKERDSYKNELIQIDKALRREGSEEDVDEGKTQTIMDKVMSLTRQNSLLRRNIQEVRAELNTSNVDLRKAQLSSFKQAQTGWFVEEDSKIRDALTQLYKDVRHWAKTYCVKSLQGFRKFPDGDCEHISKVVSKVAFFRSSDDFLSFKYPFLILAAMVSDRLSAYIFDDYFYIFRNLDEDDDGAYGEILEDAFNRLCNGNATEAHTWRALLFKTLFPATESPELNLGMEFSVNDSKRILEWITNDILYGPVSAFLHEVEKKEEERCHSKLKDLISRAMKLFSRLQTQRADYAWRKSSELLRTKFDVHSRKISADRLHKLEDDEDESCNGKKIKLVVSPAVQKYGDSNGENFQTTRFITKAIVFLEG